MAAAYYQQLARICGKEETLRDAKELLNIARSRTGPGSGHDLGKNAIALPAICALLASERLGNNDVAKKVAQDVSCLRPKDFETALSTVQGALSNFLTRRSGKGISYKLLCRSHGLSDDALYWMEEVDKELRKSGELDDMDMEDETVMYMVFYWTCIALNIRSVKQSTIIADYKVPLRTFQELENVLESTCGDLKESMGKFANEARASRSSANVSISTPKTGTQKSFQSLKNNAEITMSPSKSVTKTPIRFSAQSREIEDGSPLKRKVTLPPLPFMSPTKRQKTASPMKLNRLPVVTSTSPSKFATPSASIGASPVKTYGANRSFAQSPVKPIPLANVEERILEMPHGKHSHIPDELPSTPVKNRLGYRLSSEQSTPSPRKSLRNRTPTTRALMSAPEGVKFSRSRPNQTVRSSVEMEDVEVEDSEHESSGDVETKPPRCRHLQPVLADRLFYQYRDPRVLREWEACEKAMKVLMECYEDLPGEVIVH